MTLLIIIGILIVLFILLMIAGVKSDFDDLVAMGTALLLTAIVCFVIATVNLVNSDKNGLVDYQQLKQEKQLLQAMVEDNNIVDRFDSILPNKVKEYNDKVIFIKVDSTRWIAKDFYSKRVDWQSLELIDWE